MMHKVTTRVVAVLCLVVLITNLQTAQAGNPLLSGTSIYVSHQGVYRFDNNHRQPSWSSLIGVETFEPVTHENLLLVGSTQGLYALDRESGRVVWHIEKQHTIFTPTIATQIFAGSVHGELYAIDASEGRIIWRSQFSGWIYSPVVNTATARLWTGGQDHKIYAISSIDGAVQFELETTQELVYSPVALDQHRIAVNLFDGSTQIINTTTSKLAAILEGDAQPMDLRFDNNRIYRSHRDGSLSVFDGSNYEPSWSKSFTTQDLSLHPALPGSLLLSDRDRRIILIDLDQNNAVCRLHPDSPWLLPIQIESKKIIFFYKTMQPPGLNLVQSQALCK